MTYEETLIEANKKLRTDIEAKKAYLTQILANTDEEKKKTEEFRKNFLKKIEEMFGGQSNGSKVTDVQIVEK